MSPSNSKRYTLVIGCVLLSSVSTLTNVTTASFIFALLVVCVVFVLAKVVVRVFYVYQRTPAVAGFCVELLTAGKLVQLLWCFALSLGVLVWCRPLSVEHLILSHLSDQIIDASHIASCVFFYFYYLLIRL